MTLTKVKALYDQDFALWIDETVKQLKQGDFSQIYVENLIEEVECLGKSQRKAVRSYLLLLHLLHYNYFFTFLHNIIIHQLIILFPEIF